MIFMGNGYASLGQCYERVNTLMRLFENLGGLQQGIHSSDPAWGDYEDEVEIFLSQLRRDLLEYDT
jgi:hypothetical protein